MKEKIFCIKKSENSDHAKKWHLYLYTLLRLKYLEQPSDPSCLNLKNIKYQTSIEILKAATKEKLKKNVSIKKCMKNMIHLSVLANVNAFYPFSDLLKAYETLTSKRSVEFVKIFSFFKNLHLNIWFLAEEKFSWAMQLRYLSGRSKYV